MHRGKKKKKKKFQAKKGKNRGETKGMILKNEKNHLVGLGRKVRRATVARRELSQKKKKKGQQGVGGRR